MLGSLGGFNLESGLGTEFDVCRGDKFEIGP